MSYQSLTLKRAQREEEWQGSNPSPPLSTLSSLALPLAREIEGTLHHQAGGASVHKTSAGARVDDYGRVQDTSFSSYFSNKIQKSREQFTCEATSVAATKDPSTLNIFRSVCVWVDGFTTPNCFEIKGIMMAHGGRWEQYFESGVVTHIVADTLAETHVSAYHDGFSV